MLDEIVKPPPGGVRDGGSGIKYNGDNRRFIPSPSKTQDFLSPPAEVGIGGALTSAPPPRMEARR
jgi:hypothetical protein